MRGVCTASSAGHSRGGLARLLLMLLPLRAATGGQCCLCHRRGQRTVTGWHLAVLLHHSRDVGQLSSQAGLYLPLEVVQQVGHSSSARCSCPCPCPCHLPCYWCPGCCSGISSRCLCWRRRRGRERGSGSRLPCSQLSCLLLSRGQLSSLLLRSLLQLLPRLLCRHVCSRCLLCLLPHCCKLGSLLVKLLLQRLQLFRSSRKGSCQLSKLLLCPAARCRCLRFRTLQLLLQPLALPLLLLLCRGARCSCWGGCWQSGGYCTELRILLLQLGALLLQINYGVGQCGELAVPERKQKQQGRGGAGKHPAAQRRNPVQHPAAGPVSNTSCPGAHQ